MLKMKTFRNLVVFRAIRVLPETDRRKIPLVLLAGVLLSFLDLLGVAIIGVVAALSISGIKSDIPGNKVNAVLEFIHLEGSSLQSQVAILGISAALILISKTLISSALVRKTTYFLSRRGAQISSELTHKLLSTNPQLINSRSPQENLYSLTNGVIAIAIGIIATSIAVVADIVLLVVLFCGLLAFDFKMAILTISLFSIAAIALYKYMQNRAKIFGQMTADISVESAETILESIYSFRELFVRDQRSYYINRISDQRRKYAEVSAALANMPNFSKYAIEITLVVGAVLMSAMQFWTRDAVQAAAVLSVFLAASTRIAPAVLRIQQGALQIRSQEGAASGTFLLLTELAQVKPVPTIRVNSNFQYTGFSPQIQVRNVSFNYSASTGQSLKNVSLDIKEGALVAIVGPSGAGKSTLVDVILGIQEPSEGLVEISGVRPQDAITNWPGAISYLPQEVVLFRGTIESNITLGYENESVSTERILNTLKIAQLESMIETLPQGIYSEVHDRGENFSGGQKQRIGIARALYSNPKLIVLDESTSALDNDTESAFTLALKVLKGTATIIVIAHKLSSIVDYDCIYYLENGEIKGSGTFNELKQAIPNFAIQAERVNL